MKLRPYQSDCIQAVLANFKEHNSALAVLATGLGKTVILSHLANEWRDGRILVIAHRDELIRQAADKLRRITGEPPAIEMGTERSREDLCRAKVVVSSVQTIKNERRHRVFNPEEFGLIITDEAHHAVAKTYRQVYRYFRDGLRDKDGAVLVPGNPAIKHLGVTATPKRLDDLAMGQVYDVCAFDYGIESAIHDGWLVPVRQKVVIVKDLDFSRVRDTAGDLNEKDLEKILVEEEHLHAMAAPTVELADGKSTLVFCVTVRHAELMAAVLNRYRPDSAMALSGQSDPQLRRTVVRSFKEGQIQFLCNCALFLEGFDAPQTALIVMGRPTSSLALYMQILGRGTRPLDGVVEPFASSFPDVRRHAIAASQKPDMMVLDFAGNSGRHKIVTALDVLGGKWGSTVQQYAKQTLGDEGGQPPTIDEVMERAQAELLLEQQEQQRRQRVKASKVVYGAQDVSPFAGGQAQPKPADAPREPCSDKQARYLVYLSDRFGGNWTFETAKRLTPKQASGVIGRYRKEAS